MPLQVCTGPEGSSSLRLPDFMTIDTGPLYPPVNIPGTHLCLRLNRPQGHSAMGTTMSMKNSNDTIGN